LVLGRTIPGFSSDSIRLDQARSTKRSATNVARQNKLKVLADAKVSWRKDREAKREVAMVV